MLNVICCMSAQFSFAAHWRKISKCDCASCFILSHRTWTVLTLCRGWRLFEFGGYLFQSKSTLSIFHYFGRYGTIHIIKSNSLPGKLKNAFLCKNLDRLEERSVVLRRNRPRMARVGAALMLQKILRTELISIFKKSALVLFFGMKLMKI